MIKLLLINYWQVSNLKRKPEDTPYSLLLCAISMFLFITIMIMQWQVSDFKGDYGIWNAIATVICLVLSYILFTFIILQAKQLSSRLIQTLTCLWFTHSIIHLLACPLLFMAPFLINADFHQPLYFIGGIAYLLLTLALSIWQFIITAHIYKYALNISVVQSIVAAFGLLAVNILTVSLWR